jgi:ABC-type multidrug transport system fused ATPase/permease subunit
MKEFEELKALVESATSKRIYKHIGEGGFKATLRLIPWFLPQLSLAGFIASSARALNKILRPTITETTNYRTWWGKAVMKSFDLAEGELNLSDPFSRIFFISDGLMTMLDDRYKLKFAKYVADIASLEPDDKEVPEFFVENELRRWLNDKFLLDPPLAPKTKIHKRKLKIAESVITEQFNPDRLYPKDYILRVLKTAPKEFKSIKYFVDKYAADVADGARASAKLQYISFVPKLIIEATFIIGVATYALVAIRTGNLTDALVNISFFVAMGSRVIPSLLRLHFSVSQVKQIRGTTIHTQKLVAREYLLAEGDKKIEEGKFIREDLNSEEILLEMDSVHFQYPNTNEEAISDFSLKITKAQSLGVVGRTGSGKSTIIDLILGTIVPSRGNVVLRYEGKIGFVPQSIALIDGTIIDNLLLGRDLSNYSTEDFNLALRLAGLLPHIDSLDEKLHHKLSRAGSELSGGQRQKLGIARALLDKPQLLVLDEASSSLDQESEDYLNNTIESLKGKVTIIMIAHRLTTIRNLDQVILVEKGRLVAQGKFEELVRTNQLFSDFVRYSQIK